MARRRLCRRAACLMNNEGTPLGGSSKNTVAHSPPAASRPWIAITMSPSPTASLINHGKTPSLCHALAESAAPFLPRCRRLRYYCAICRMMPIVFFHADRYIHDVITITTFRLLLARLPRHHHPLPDFFCAFFMLSLFARQIRFDGARTRLCSAQRHTFVCQHAIAPRRHAAARA